MLFIVKNGNKEEEFMKLNFISDSSLLDLSKGQICQLKIIDVTLDLIRALKTFGVAYTLFGTQYSWELSGNRKECKVEGIGDLERLHSAQPWCPWPFCELNDKWASIV